MQLMMVSSRSFTQAIPAGQLLQATCSLTFATQKTCQMHLETTLGCSTPRTGKLSVGLAGFGLPGVAWNSCVVSDSISRYCREGSVIGKCCPSRKPALFNKQCPLKKFKIYQRKNTASCYHQCSRASWNWFEVSEDILSLTAHLTMQLGS